MKIITILSFVLCFSTVFSQEVEMSLIGEDYSLNKEFKVKYTIHFNEDSISVPPFNGFVVVAGPETENEVSILNGEMTRVKSWTYTLKIDQKGSLELLSLVFYRGGKQFKAKSKIIQVD